MNTLKNTLTTDQANALGHKLWKEYRFFQIAYQKAVRTNNPDRVKLGKKLSDARQAYLIAKRDYGTATKSELARIHD